MIAIMFALGFKLERSNKHPCYERPADEKRPRALVPVDDYEEFDETMIKSMVSQSGFTQEEFYSSTKKTGKKINAKKLFSPCRICGEQVGQNSKCEGCLAFKAA